jgi:uncharacterized damage-inducible protein DinB
MTLATVALGSLISFKSVNENPPLTKTAAMIADWQRAKAYTLEYLSAANEDLIAFKPTAEMRTFGQQMLHISESNYGFGSAAAGKTSPVIFGQLEKAAADYKTIEALTKAVMDSYDFVISALKGIDESKMGEPIRIFNKFEMTREVGFKKAFEHQTHHRGQTTVYLRLMGITPPNERLL